MTRRINLYIVSPLLRNWVIHTSSSTSPTSARHPHPKLESKQYQQPEEQLFVEFDFAHQIYGESGFVKCGTFRDRNASGRSGSWDQNVARASTLSKTYHRGWIVLCLNCSALNFFPKEPLQSGPLGQEIKQCCLEKTTLFGRSCYCFYSSIRHLPRNMLFIIRKPGWEFITGE